MQLQQLQLPNTRAMEIVRGESSQNQFCLLLFQIQVTNSRFNRTSSRMPANDSEVEQVIYKRKRKLQPLTTSLYQPLMASSFELKQHCTAAERGFDRRPIIRLLEYWRQQGSLNTILRVACYFRGMILLCESYHPSKIHNEQYWRWKKAKNGIAA
jgi:hypothetical protein